MNQHMQLIIKNIFFFCGVILLKCVSVSQASEVQVTVKATAGWPKDCRMGIA